MTVTTNGKFTYSPQAYSQSSWTTSGALTVHAGATVTDSSTAGSGTAASAVFHSYSAPTLAATNTLVTTTDAATVYIAGGPTAGTNQTLGNSWGLWNVGKTRLDNTLAMTTGRAILLYTPDNTQFATLQMTSGPVVTLNYPMTFTSGTTSTAINSGTIVVTGGIGISGAENLGGRLTIGANASLAAWNSAGPQLYCPTFTYTDTSSSGTQANTTALNSMLASVIAASSATTYNNAATLYLALHFGSRSRQ